MTTTFATDRAGRLRAAAARVRKLAPEFGDRLTSPDPGTGERWERGQVLSHVVELLPYWAEQVRRVVSAGGGGVAFGRVKTTPSRIERIEAGRHDEPGSLLDRMEEEVERVVGVLEALTDGQLALVGHHQTLGDMTVAGIVDEFLVEHMEQHADQLAEQLG